MSLLVGRDTFHVLDLSLDALRGAEELEVALSEGPNKDLTTKELRSLILESFFVVGFPFASP